MNNNNQLQNPKQYNCDGYNCGWLILAGKEEKRYFATTLDYFNSEEQVV